MKDPREWTEDYLLTLPIGEFDWLEVKGRRGLDLSHDNVQEKDVRRNLSVALSAFANSGGGQLVYGLANPQETWAVDDGGVMLTARRPNTREWLEDVIPSLVDGPLTSFNVYAVQGGEKASSIASGRGVFIIDIPDSDQAPHQASDHRYYARVAGKSRPIGHKLVADIFSRRRFPKLELSFTFVVSSYVDPQSSTVASFPPGRQRASGPRKRKLELRAFAHNSGKVLAQFAYMVIYIPVELVPGEELEYDYHKSDFEEIDGRRYIAWQRRNVRRDIAKANIFGASEYGASWYEPILPGLSHVWEWQISDDYLERKNELANISIHWEAFADNATSEKGSVKLGDIEIIDRS